MSKRGGGKTKRLKNIIVVLQEGKNAYKYIWMLSAGRRWSRHTRCKRIGGREEATTWLWRSALDRMDNGPWGCCSTTSSGWWSFGCRTSYIGWLATPGWSCPLLGRWRSLGCHAPHVGGWHPFRCCASHVGWLVALGWSCPLLGRWHPLGYFTPLVGWVAAL